MITVHARTWLVVGILMCSLSTAWAAQDASPQAGEQGTTSTPAAVGYSPLPSTSSALPVTPAAPGLQQTIIQPVDGRLVPTATALTPTPVQEAATFIPPVTAAMQGPANLPTGPGLTSPAGVMAPPPDAGRPYTLGRDDVVRITVRGQPDFTGDFVIGPTGMIQYGYLGDIRAEGLSKEALAQVITDNLRLYVREPQTSIQIVGYNSKTVYVIGEVNRPGRYAMQGDEIKLSEALVAAGLTNTRAANSRVKVITPDPKKPKTQVINAKEILFKGKRAHDVILKPNDTVYVPSTVYTKVNDFLAKLFSPVTRGVSAVRTLNPF